jgi:hypothetical protein
MARRWLPRGVALLVAMAGLIVSAHAEDCGFRTPPDISIEKELMITDLSVVDDARAETPGGPWSFGYLLQSLTQDHAAARLTVKDWLRSWSQPFTVNGFTTAPRPEVDRAIVRPWMARDGATAIDDWLPDLDHAPFRLLAIVYRPDLNIIGQDGAIASAGEARFVFAALDLSHGSRLVDAAPLPFTVIFEYALPANNRDQVRQWAARWHGLGHVPFGPRYNAALEGVTRAFDGSTDKAAPPRLRTNDGLAAPWQLREFHFDSGSGRFGEAAVTNTPDLSLIDHTAELSAQLNAHPGDDIPSRFLGGAAEIPDAAFRWPAMQTANNVIRHNFAMLTCNGCHSAETGRKADEQDSGATRRGFRHLAGRQHGVRATQSEFLTGNPAVVADPNGKLQTFCDLKLRQKALFEALQAVESPDVAHAHAGFSVARERRKRTD